MALNPMLQAIRIGKHFGSRTLFTDLSWQLRPGDRVGVVGPNGAGKTTLLQLMAGQQICDAGTIVVDRDQTLGYLPQEAPRVDGGTVLERVMGAAEAICGVRDALERVETELAEAGVDVGRATRLAAEHAELTDRFGILDGYTLVARSEEVLLGLGFAPAALGQPVGDLSGGWWMRVELARLLLLRPDYLLLDEPTNHLDLSSLDWLAGFLRGYPGAWAMVSHDRHFLNRTVQQVAELSADGLFVFPGNYDSYQLARAALSARLAAEATSHRRRVTEITAFIDRWQASAARSKQATSRVKLLERLGSAPVVAAEKKALRFALPPCPRASKQVLRLEKIDKAYGSKVLYRQLYLSVERGDRLALVGDNGAGKSTLLKILAGVEPVDAGDRVLGINTVPTYFAQHALDTLNASLSVFAEMQKTMPAGSLSQIRGMLGSFLFTKDDVEKPVSVLSGGEKSRLALAKMLARPANLLLLDEPTNHLDLQSRAVIEAALEEFSGSLVFISHDRYFLNRLANKVLYVKEGGATTSYTGTYDQFVDRAQEDASVAPTSAGPTLRQAAEPTQRQLRKQVAAAAAQRAKRLAKAESDIERSEADIKRIDAELCLPQVYADAAGCRQRTLQRADLQRELDGLWSLWEELSTGL
jgi:ATP-binding cassette subfamily F protein 3